MRPSAFGIPVVAVLTAIGVISLTSVPASSEAFAPVAGIKTHGKTVEEAPSPSSLESADDLLASVDWSELKSIAEKCGIPSSLIPHPTPLSISALPPHERPLPESALEKFQGRPGNPSAWQPDEPFNLDRYTPTSHDVRKAIADGVKFVLDDQNENGSWDVTLTGFLGETADQAVDAVIATSMAGLALRPHTNVDPERINTALKRGADYVMARIIRGKLSLQVYYAAWRYILGLRFLNQEYGVLDKATVKDTERMDEIKLVMKRMMQSLLDMQLSSTAKGTVDGKKKRKIKSRGVKGDAQYATLGMKMSPPTDQDFRGGAPVAALVPGGPAEKMGIKPGDRVIRVNKFVKIENAYDYYMEEANFLEGQTHEVEYIRPTGTDEKPRVVKVQCKIEQRWPANIGVTIESNGNEGVRVTGFTPMSGSRKELMVGDVITKINREDLVSDPKVPESMNADWVKRYYEIERELKPLTTIRLAVIRDGKKKNISLSKDQVRAKPEGSLGFTPLEEDRCSLDGVSIFEIEPRGVGAAAGLQKGDRITEIDGTPVLGYDHYFSIMSQMWSDTLVKVKYLRPNFVWDEGGESKTPITTLDDVGSYSEQEIELRVGPSIEPGDMQCDFDVHFLPAQGKTLLKVISVKKGGVSDGKLKPGDIILKYNGTEYSHWIELLWNCLWRTSVGEEVEFTVIRGSKDDVLVTIEFAKYTEEEELTAEGGWNYYPRGLGTSFTTAAVVIGLWEVEETTGFKFPDKAIKAGAAAVGTTRVIDPNKKGETYVYDQRKMDGVDAKGMANWSDIRGTIGRIVACEFAAALKDSRRGKSKLKNAIDIFLEHRHEIDRVRNFWHTHYYPRWANAAYYWFYGHYHCLMAANYLDANGKQKLTKTVHDTCLKAIMLKLNDRRPGTSGAERPQGTWVGHHDFGPLIGTCEALMCLGQIPGDFRATGDTTPDGKVITPTGTDDKGAK